VSSVVRAAAFIFFRSKKQQKTIKRRPFARKRLKELSR